MAVALGVSQVVHLGVNHLPWGGGKRRKGRRGSKAPSGGAEKLGAARLPAAVEATWRARLAEAAQWSRHASASFGAPASAVGPARTRAALSSS